MQIILEDEVERSNGGGTGSMDLVICAGRIGGCMEGERDGRNGVRRGRIRVSGGIFNMFEKGIWGRRGRIGKGSRVEEVGVGREDDGRVRSGI